MSLKIEAEKVVHPNYRYQRFVEYTEAYHNLLIFLLGNEFDYGTNVIHGSLRICITHVSTEEAYRVYPAEMISIYNRCFFLKAITNFPE
jgi:hypothetical protein